MPIFSIQLQQTSMKLRIALFTLFLTLTLSQKSSTYSMYSLTPVIPPIAFVGQYYTCAFRVNGLNYPSFTFENLPDHFTASPTGTIEGVPSAIGSYSVIVQYRSQNVVQKQTFVLRIAQPTSNSSLAMYTHNYYKYPNWIDLGAKTVYLSGNNINLNLNQYITDNGYKWTYLQLPEQLQGDDNGRLTGIFYAQGYYTFGASCSDQYGDSQDYFFTLNIQPSAQLSRNSKSLALVPNRNVYRFDISYVNALQEQAAANVYKAQKLVNSASSGLSSSKNDLIGSQSQKEMAQTQLDAVEKLVQIAIKNKAKLYSQQNKAEEDLDRAQGNYEIKKTAFDQACKQVSFIQGVLDAANAIFKKIKDILAYLSNQFITAQNDSYKAAADLQTSKRDVQNAKKDVDDSFQKVLDAKKGLQNVKNDKDTIDFDVTSALNERDVANFQNDIASSALSVKDSALNKSLLNLQAAKTTIIQLQLQKEQAKNYLGQAQFNLTQAMNTLLLAQAAKEQADKSLQIISAQSSIVPSGTTTYIFDSCEIGNYPVIFGTASLTLGEDGYTLSTGHKLVRGSCTKGNFSSDSTGAVTYEGYLKDGCVHAVRIDQI